MIQHIASLYWQFTLNNVLCLRPTCSRARRIIPRCIATLITGIKYLLAARYATDNIGNYRLPTVDVVFSARRRYAEEVYTYTYIWGSNPMAGVVHLVHNYLHGVRVYSDGDFISYYRSVHHGYQVMDYLYVVEQLNTRVYSRYLK